MKAILNCTQKLKTIIDANAQMIGFYNTIINNNELGSIDPSLKFLKAQKKRNSTNSVDSHILKLIESEQYFIKFYLEVISKLNPEGAVYQRLVNHIDEMRMSLTMLEKNIMHQQKLMTA